MTALTSSQNDSHLIAAASDRTGDDPIFALHGEAMRRAAEGEDILNATLPQYTESALETVVSMFTPGGGDIPGSSPGPGPLCLVSMWLLFPVYLVINLPPGWHLLPLVRRSKSFGVAFLELWR